MAASTFSYAQAAKGLSTPTAASKPASESGASTQDAPVNASIRSVQSWADDAETDTVNEQNAAPQITKPIQSAQPVETPSISSPDLGASSSSTVTKDDDVSSLPNASSESTWDNKSQASTSVDKSVEPVEKTSDKAKKAKSAPAKPLQEAPLPAVNIWKKRAEELKSKVQKPEPVQINGASNKKTEPETKGRATGKNQDEDRHTHGRKDTRAEGDARSKGRFSDKDAKAAANSLPPPPTRDQESWPTPDTAVDEDRKKAQDKGDKERKENPTTASHGKQEWVKVPYTPSVVFSTPLPGATGSRRGGRPGGRGGSQPSGRGAGYASNGAGSSEKDAPGAAAANGEVKRDRPENGAFRDTSPRSRRAGGASSPSHNTSAAGAVEKASQASESDAPAKPQSGYEHGQASNQTGTYTRAYPNRSNKPRRGDFSNAGERRRDGEASPTKDNTFDDRRANNDAGDAERRHSSYHDGPNGHHKQGRFGSYAGGRDRARGGNRGGRGNFANGHQYTNGHMPSVQTSGSFPVGPRSPTTFNPENPSFFSANQGKYGRNGHRSQSVTTDAYRFTPYQNGNQVPALQGYGMYDYSMMPQPPMSAVPYSPYVDHFALFAMITTQVEYYFSVDNLLKDMYLRKHMDSQGFVPLDTITNFSRIKQLSTDVELIKLVCQQSAVVEYRTGEDGQDRLRRRENWEQWVLNMADRDAKAQNEGPKELRHPPMPHVNGFEQANGAQWPMPVYGSDGSFPQMNGFAPAVGQDNAYEALPNGTASEKPQDNDLPNGHSVEPATSA